MSFFSQGWSTPPPYGGAAGGQPAPGAPGQGAAGDGGESVECASGASIRPPANFTLARLNSPGWFFDCQTTWSGQGFVYLPPAGGEYPTSLGPFPSWFDAARAYCEACAGGSTLPPPPPPPAPAPPAPGAACTPPPCRTEPPVAPNQPTLSSAPVKRDLEFCLPGFGADFARAAADKTLVDMLRAVGFLDAQGRQVWFDQTAAKIKGAPWPFEDIGMAAVNFGGWFVQQSVVIAQNIADGFADISGCKKGSGPAAVLLSLLAGAWERWIGHIPDSLRAVFEYTAGWACPNLLPEQEIVDDAYTHGLMGKDTWECFTRANGNNPTHRFYATALRYEHLSPHDIIDASTRGLFESKAEEDSAWGRAGADVEPFRRVLTGLAQFVPTPTDAVEWMSKDLGDPLLTSTFGLFNEFYQKYRGDVKQALDLNRIDEKWARLIFASHRGKAAPHQMYEMHKRLRPGWWALLPAEDALHMAQAIAPRRPTGEGGLLEQASNLQFLGQQREANALYGSDPAAVARFGQVRWVKPVVSPDPKIPVPDNLVGLPPQWLDEIGDNPEAARAYLAETVTTGFHVFEGLSQANYPPFWRARLLALSYNVMTRVDMRRAYETGQIDKETLFQKLQDRGYTPVDARYLANFYEVAATQLASRRPAVNAWVTDGYEISLLQQALLDQGMREEMWPAVRRIAETRRQIYVQQRCIRHLKKLVLAGLVEESAVAPRLVSVGLTGPEAARLSSEWACERRSIPKPESAATVCKYLTQQLIGPEQAARLIHRLGYTYREARRMVNSCLLTPVRKGTGKRDQLPDKVLKSKLTAPPEDQEAGVSAEDRAAVAVLQAAVDAAPPAARPALQRLLDAGVASIGEHPGAREVLIPGEQPEG